MGARLIGEYAEDIGLNRSFTVLDQSDAADLMNLVRQDLGLSAKESPFPTKNTCLSIYSFAVNSRMPLRKVLANHFPSWARWKRELRKLFRCYKAAKRRQNVIDYDDLLLYWAEIMDDAHLATEIRSRFDHVLVDEYQDTNRLQAEILFTVDGFSQWMRNAITGAGLPLDCQPHGLRKAAGRRLADAGCTAHEIMAVLGHKTLAEAERYTREADQVWLATEAMTKLEGRTANRNAQTKSAGLGRTDKKQR